MIDRTVFRSITGRPEVCLFSPVSIGAIIGSTLVALLLTGSQRTATSSSIRTKVHASTQASLLNSRGKKLFADAQFLEARDTFRSAATLAHSVGDERAAAMCWNNAGACSVATMRFRTALDDFSLARRTAEAAREMRPLIYTLNNLASLYIQMGEPEDALRVAREALAGPAGHADPGMRAKLFCQIGKALADLNRFSEAGPVYRQGIGALVGLNDLEGAARVWGVFGTDSLRAQRLDEAESSFNEGLRLIRIGHLKPSASILCGLAAIRSRRGDSLGAATLFEAALAAPPGLTPRWIVYADRARARLDAGDIQGALADFRQSRLLAMRLRVDVVPADQDRVALESGLSLVLQGLVDAGNRVARETGDRATLRETFDAAEQDRLWSLRALIPSPDDWRTRLPERYWNVLAAYQALERTSVEQPTPDIEKKASDLRLELQQIEAKAAGASPLSPDSNSAAASPLVHIMQALDDDSVLLSFHVTQTSSWVWAIDRHRVAAYPLPPMPALQTRVTEFSQAVRTGTSATELGHRIYQDMFGAIPATYLHHKRWLLELDGPLHDLPFAALVVDQNRQGPVYLIERAALQSIPSALLLEPGLIPADGTFLGVGDPIYNAADPRFQGKAAKAQLALPRLPNTAGELQACARAWNSPNPRLLAGADAQMSGVQTALETNPSIVHFATHVVAAPGEFRSGLIALSLDATGRMGLLGPKEIVARPVTANLIVMDGCHSAQGDALPSAGLMGLTRAWIGAGAQAVVATRWDVADDAAQSLMTRFYTSLRVSRRRGAAFALRDAQLSMLRGGDEPRPLAQWAGYFLLSRVE